MDTGWNHSSQIPPWWMKWWKRPPYFTLLLFRHDLRSFLFLSPSLLLLHLSKFIDCCDCSWSYDCATFEENVLFKCGGEIVRCLGFSRLMLLFWFFFLCTTLHVSLWILGYVQVIGNCFWNRSFLEFCELKSLFFSTYQVSFKRLNWKW